MLPRQSKTTTPAVVDEDTMLAAPTTVVDTREYQNLAQWYWDTFPALAQDTAMVHTQIMQRLLTDFDDDPETVLDVPETLDSASLWTHKALRLHGIESVMPSSYGGIYVVVRVSKLDDKSGEVFNFALGSPTLLAQLATLYRGGKIPCDVKIVPIKKGGREGRNPPLYFRRVDY